MDIDVTELARWREEGRDFTLLDVREPNEVSIVALPNSVHIPMREIPSRAAELDRNATIAVMCHHGGRSARVADFLSAQGFANVVNVDGGIESYAIRVDPSLPRY